MLGTARSGTELRLLLEYALSRGFRTEAVSDGVSIRTCPAQKIAAQVLASKLPQQVRPHKTLLPQSAGAL